MGPYTVMIARFPGQNQEHPDSAGYIMGLMETLHNDDRVSKIIPWKLSDTPITMSRNRCIKDALEIRADYVLMIDADMSPDCEPGAPPFWDTAWAFMMDRREKEDEYRAKRQADLEPSNAPKTQIADAVIEASRIHFPYATIAAPYCGPPPVENCYVFRWFERESHSPSPCMRLQMIDRDDAARRTGIEEVAALPTGLILYDSRIFSMLPPPWFDYEWTDEYRTQKSSTEDVFQTRNASLMGLPQFVAWDCWAGHVKNKLVRKPFPLSIKTMNEQFRAAVMKSAT